MINIVYCILKEYDAMCGCILFTYFNGKKKKLKRLSTQYYTLSLKYTY